MFMRVLVAGLVLALAGVGFAQQMARLQGGTTYVMFGEATMPCTQRFLLTPALESRDQAAALQAKLCPLVREKIGGDEPCPTFAYVKPDHIAVTTYPRDSGERDDHIQAVKSALNDVLGKQAWKTQSADHFLPGSLFTAPVLYTQVQARLAALGLEEVFVSRHLRPQGACVSASFRVPAGKTLDTAAVLTAVTRPGRVELRLLPADLKWQDGAFYRGEKRLTDLEGLDASYFAFDGSAFQRDAGITLDAAAQPAVSFSFTPEAGPMLAALTKSNVGRQLMIMLDGQVLMAPVVRDTITGTGIISGLENIEQAKEVSQAINNGELAAQINFSGLAAVPDISDIPGIAPYRYPRLNGSTSCTLLGQLILGRACGLRGEIRRGSLLYYGTVPTATVTYPLDTPQSRLEICEDLYGYAHFAGIDKAYLGLCSPYQTPAFARSRSATVDDMEHPVFFADIILAARKPSASELAAAEKAGIEYDARPIARDALVFLVNDDNPVTGLTLDQVRAIYRGTAKNWKELGGQDAPIAVYVRNRDSGSRELTEEPVMPGDQLTAVQDSLLPREMAAPIEYVAQNPAAIAYSVYYYERIMHPRAKNRPLAINGVLPTPRTIADGSYPLVSDVYVVIRKDTDPASPAARLRDWLLSPDGQALVKDSGYVPVSAGK